MFNFTTEQYLPVTINSAWSFFSAPENLALITPPSLDFIILNKSNDGEIKDGMIINYRVKPMLGIPVKWKTQICNVRYGESFMDKQLLGPYKLWEHTHTFTPAKKGILMRDVINYELPFGPLGRLAHALFVRNKIASIFDYRKNILEQLFKKNGHISQ